MRRTLFSAAELITNRFVNARSYSPYNGKYLRFDSPARSTWSYSRPESSDGVFSRLLEERIIYIYGRIDDDATHRLVAQLLFLDSKSPSEPIHMYFNSDSSFDHSGLEIYEAMQYVKAPIKTTCFGKAEAVNSLLLASGTKGERRSLAKATIGIPHFACSTTSVAELYSKHTGLPVDVIQKIAPEFYGKVMSPEEAKEFGIIDEVIYPSKTL